MGCMARLLKNPEFIKEMAQCQNNADVMKVVMEHERVEFLARENGAE